MDGNAVSLAAIALAATSMGGVIWLAKYFANELSNDLKEHTKAAVAATGASKEQTSASKEVLTFMKNLNGKLASATIQTVKEQHIGTQVVTTENVDKKQVDTQVTERRKQ